MTRGARNQIIIRLHGEGHSLGQIATTVGMTKARVCQLTKDYERRCRVDIVPTLPPEELSPQQASILHLLDLKRAGLSPTRTELHLMGAK